MANSENWVEQRLAALTPPENWNPDPEGALYRVRRKPARAAWPSWRLRAATACVAGAALMALPQTRALAQRAWQLFFARELHIIRTNDLDVEPIRAHFLLKPKQEQVRDREEASRRAGFTAHLPKPGVLDRAPVLSILSPTIAELILNNDDLEKALQKAGVVDLRPPKEWDGARIRAHFNFVVMAEYPDITLAQLPHVVISAPPGFQLTSFTEMALRILGLDGREAKRYAARVATSPAWFIGIPREDNVSIREVTLNAGTGTLFREYGDKGEFERLTMIWSTADRLYVLSAKINDELAITIANSLQ